MRQLAVGRGDHWITGGALAISTLAAGRITPAARNLHALSGIIETLKVSSLALWALTIAWLPVLLAAELLRPRLRYDVRRWSTVFPVGMYAACSFAVGAAAGAPGDCRLRPDLGVGRRRSVAVRVPGDARPRAAACSLGGPRPR
jgi:hypothetical protein